MTAEREEKASAGGSSFLRDAVAEKDAVVPCVDGVNTVTPECERVCGGCGVAGIGYKCGTHHGPWPSGTDRCPAAMAGNVTT